MRVLVIDVGGSHVKVLATGHRDPVKIDSGPKYTAADMVRDVRQATGDWKYNVVTIGYPGPVVHGRPLQDPANLGKGWVRFDFERAFGKPVRILNDAAMQALGSYRGGRMLFLGLGTGLGIAAVHDGHVDALELAHLPYKNGRTYEDYLGERGLERMGRKRWEAHVHRVATTLREALVSDYVVIGGGNARRLRRLPAHARRGDNSNAFVGGMRVWAPPLYHQRLRARRHR
jgi:polyphosphate glucokinase